MLLGVLGDDGVIVGNISVVIFSQYTGRHLGCQISSCDDMPSRHFGEALATLQS